MKDNHDSHSKSPPPKNVQNIIEQSWTLRKAKRLQEAKAMLQEALELFPEGSYESTLMKANLSDLLLRLKNPEEAKKMALEALVHNPNQGRALAVLGLAALNAKNYEEAIENLERAHASIPSPYLSGRLAKAYELAEEDQKALQVLEKTLEGNPGDRFLLKQYAALKKKTAQAGAAHREIFRIPLAEEDPFAYAEHLKEKLGHLRPGEAAAQLQKIVKVGKRKENPYLHIFLGDLQRKIKKDQDAALTYQKARQLEPENRYALSQEAFCYRRLGKKEKAWPLLKRLLSLNPADHAAKSAFLKDSAELGKNQAALEFLEELLHNHPHHKELYGAIKKLQKNIPQR